MPRAPAVKKKSSPRKAPVERKSVNSFLLSRPDSSLTLTNFATVYSTLTVQACVENGRISKIGFSVEKNEKLLRYVQQIGDLLVGQTPEEVESLSLHELFQRFSPPHEERVLLEFALSAWQDVVARLPTQDPLSGALQSLKYYNREFPRGTLLPDLED